MVRTQLVVLGYDDAACEPVVLTDAVCKDPCHPLAGGFFSGFTPTASSSEESTTTWIITVNSTKPIWVYCAQGNHCQSGMVAAINV